MAPTFAGTGGYDLPAGKRYRQTQQLMRNRKSFFPIILVFIILNALFIAGRTYLEKWNVDQDVLLIGNAFLFVITLCSFIIAGRGLNTTNPHAFVRSVYASIMIKLFISIIAAFIYIATFKKELNKPAFFTVMALYLVYSFIEVSILTKLLKLRKNA
jgi:hypothetical protein